MKKKILLTLSALTLMSAFTGCAQTPAVTAPNAQTTMRAETLRLETGKTMEAPAQSPKEEVRIQTHAPTLQETPEAVKKQEKEPAKTEKQEKPTPEPTGKADAPKPTKQPDTPKPTLNPTSAQTKQPEKPKPTKQTVTSAPMQEQTPEPTKAPASTPEPTPEPTSAPQPEMEVMGGGFNSEVLAAVNEARALQGNTALSLDSGLCAKAVEHAKEMARQGKAFHSCGGVESVSDSSGSGKTIGARSAIHASDLELNGGLTSLGVGSVRIGDKQYTCVIGR